MAQTERAAYKKGGGGGTFAPTPTHSFIHSLFVCVDIGRSPRGAAATDDVRIGQTAAEEEEAVSSSPQCGQKFVKKGRRGRASRSGGKEGDSSANDVIHWTASALGAAIDGPAGTLRTLLAAATLGTHKLAKKKCCAAPAVGTLAERREGEEKHQQKNDGETGGIVPIHFHSFAYARGTKTAVEEQHTHIIKLAHELTFV
ncbi:hypothetical protein niasHT_012583 [Heterodera trifolii]|uniref:Uncharacterized protein n=1 Tax=Heterodera trifolii TaxID=157864 RepID=A0ABD2L1H0_9BILA